MTRPTSLRGFPGGVSGNPPAIPAGDVRDTDSIPGSGKSPGEGNDNLQYSCLENPHGQRSLEGYSPWGRKELDRTERLLLSQTHAIVFRIARKHCVDILFLVHPHCKHCISNTNKSVLHFECIIHTFTEYLGTVQRRIKQIHRHLRDYRTVFCHSSANEIQSMTTLSMTCPVVSLQPSRTALSPQSSPLWSSGVCESSCTLASPGLGLTWQEVILRLL